MASRDQGGRGFGIGQSYDSRSRQMGGGALRGRQTSQQSQSREEEIRRRVARKVLWFLNRNKDTRIRRSFAASRFGSESGGTLQIVMSPRTASADLEHFAAIAIELYGFGHRKLVLGKCQMLQGSRQSAG